MAGNLIAEAAGAEHEDEALADARRFEFDDETIAAIGAEISQVSGSGFSGVWPENADAVAAFLLASSQWRTEFEIGEEGFRTRFIGLDYVGAKVALDAMEIVVTPTLWVGLVVMEQAARRALNGG